MQLGLFNWRKGGKWYSRLTPIVAIRTGKKKPLEDKAE